MSSKMNTPSRLIIAFVVMVASGFVFVWGEPHLATTKAALAAGESADFVVKSANVITVDAGHPRAQAFAVLNGRFTIIGSNEAVAAAVGPKTTVLDFAGKTITLGFIDAHAHPVPVYPDDSVWASVDCRPLKVKNIGVLVAALKRRAEKTTPGEWIVGDGFENLKLGRQSTRWDLDGASTRHPIVIDHYSGHERVCNSLAMQMSKITRDTAEPLGGRFVCDENGELTGLMEEKAAFAIATTSVPPPSEMRAGFTRGYQQFLSRGVTTVGVAGSNAIRSRALENARTQEIPLRLCIALGENSSPKPSHANRPWRMMRTVCAMARSKSFTAPRSRHTRVGSRNLTLVSRTSSASGPRVRRKT